MILLMSGLLLNSCSGPSYRTDGSGVTVKVQNVIDGGPRLVRLEVMGDKLIHVSATPEKKFAGQESLVIIPASVKTPFTVEQKDDTVSVVTSAVKACVLASTGEVWFTDAEGNVILEEQKGGGKCFEPIEVEGTHGYTFRQIFDSPEDEAFYGLGQHQADEFNYKGKNEQLFQYNTKVSIPFIVSNKGYGVLMDSYSMMRFGNPEDYKQLGDVFKLYDKNGKEGCLTGTYVPFRGETLVRDESKIYFEYLVAPELTKVVNLPEDFRLMNSNVSYEGFIEAPATGEYQFILYYAGYMTVTVGGETVVPERWRTAWNPNSYKFSVNLKAGEKTSLRIDWKPDGSESYCGLRVYDVVDPVEQAKHQWWSEMSKQMDWYFIAGNDMDEIVSGYRTLTGKAPIMPKWAMGYWQSRERYKTSTEMIDALKGFRQRNIPIDNIVLDWQHWELDSWGSHEFDAARFPDPKAMTDSIHDLVSNNYQHQLL